MTKVVDAAVVVLVYCLYRGNTKRSGVFAAVRVETAVSTGPFLASLCKVTSNQIQVNM